MSTTELAFKPFTRQQMAQRAASDIPEGWYVNLASASRR
jgi:3-oxoadipate CoA-transferase beta subunit